MRVLIKRILFVFTVAFLPLLTIPRAEPAMVELSLEQLTRDADLIVVGKVESVASQMIIGKIWSSATISVESRIKGDEPEQSEIVVSFPGGKVGDIGMQVEDSPNYKKDEEVVVFLKKMQGESHFSTAGSSQGKFIIEGGIVLRENIPLEEFLARIESIIKTAP
jgi:hypothetical protein